MTEPFIVELLHRRHDRAGFACGVAALDQYLQTQAMQDVRRRVAACYVALETPGETKIAGYYTLAAGGIPLADLPKSLAKRLPRYPSVPVARLGRLAVARAYQGRKLGSSLLWSAGTRASRAELAAFALVVDAKDDRAAAFYRHHGFEPLESQPRQLVLPLSTFGIT